MGILNFFRKSDETIEEQLRQRSRRILYMIIEKQKTIQRRCAALLALAFLFVMTATEGPYWGEADVKDSIVMIQEKEQGQSESDILTGMTIVRRQIHSLYKEGQNIPVTTCEETEYIISNGKKIPKTEACKEAYVETKAEEQEEPYKN